MSTLSNIKNKIFYSIRPLVPRRVQLLLRRCIATYKRNLYSGKWPIDKDAAAIPSGWKGWPGNNKFALVLQHDVDTQRGHDRCRLLMDLEDRLGVKSTFYVVPERYQVSESLLLEIRQRGFGLGVHGLKHDGKLFSSYDGFVKDAGRINGYLNEWKSKGFSTPSMLQRREWMHHLDIAYCTSSFDTDPFEPQPDPVKTIFPFVYKNCDNGKTFVELPYTLPQDFTLFIILQERDSTIWKNKLAWIGAQKGMALMNTHPDYMDFGNGGFSYGREEYPVEIYNSFITYVKNEYHGVFWNPLSSEIADYVDSMERERS